MKLDMQNVCVCAAAVTPVDTSSSMCSRQDQTSPGMDFMVRSWPAHENTRMAVNPNHSVDQVAGRSGLLGVMDLSLSTSATINRV